MLSAAITLPVSGRAERFVGLTSRDIAAGDIGHRKDGQVHGQRKVLASLMSGRPSELGLCFGARRIGSVGYIGRSCLRNQTASAMSR